MSDQPEPRSYGTCLSCTQSVSMVTTKNKPNVTKKHYRKVTFGSHMQGTVLCRGSFDKCAEQVGVEWLDSQHRWVDVETGQHAEVNLNGDL